MLPEGWVWCKLEDIATFGGGKTPSMDIKEYWNKGKNLWVTSKDMKNDSIHDSLMKITDEALNIMTQYEKDTLLVVTRSGILRHTLPIAILEKNATINQDIKSIMPLNGIIPKFLFYAIKANENIILTEYHKDGTTVDSIDFDKFKCLPIPLPPINEQKRIITEVLKVSASIDCIDCGKADLYITIAQAKSKILDLAIHGKLVPQDPTDEPASELLKRINPKAEITCDNGHYQKLPEGWCECCFDDIFNIKMGQSPNGSSINHQQGVEFHQGKILFGDKYLKQSDMFTDAPTKLATANSLLLCVRAPVGVVNITQREICIGRGLCSLKPNAAINLNYAYHALTTYQSDFESKSTGSTFKAISGSIIRNEVFALPPLQEQHRIVSKIEEIFTQLDAIEASL